MLCFSFVTKKRFSWNNVPHTNTHMYVVHHWHRQRITSIGKVTEIYSTMIIPDFYF